MDSLLPCPFCGSSQLEMQHTSAPLSGEEYFIWCDGCDMRGSIHHSAEDAGSAWNTRTPPASGDGKGEFRQRSDDCREWEQPTPAAEAPAWDHDKLRSLMEDDCQQRYGLPWRGVYVILTDALALGGLRG